jgi:hypothetical protein
MTRCLDCGAERNSDQCMACGLTSEAAELVLRRRLVSRTAIFLVGALIFVPASQMYPPLDLDQVWIFFGVIFFAAIWLAFWIDLRARQRGEVEILKRIFFGLAPLPWIVALLLLTNGRFDKSPQIREPAQVVGRFNMGGYIFRSRRLDVTSWRPDHAVERVPVQSFDYDRFHAGDRVFVGMHSGLLDIPWVFAVYRDDSKPNH